MTHQKAGKIGLTMFFAVWGYLLLLVVIFHIPWLENLLDQNLPMTEINLVIVLGFSLTGFVFALYAARFRAVWFVVAIVNILTFLLFLFVPRAV